MAQNPRSRLCERSCDVLREGARAVGQAVYDSRGYATVWTDNLMCGLPLDDIRSDFHSAAGHELDDKFCAAHSSAALVVNTFGYWRRDPQTLSIAGLGGFRQLCFEAQLPTGLQGTPPHLDVLAQGESVLAIESKCTEWMSGKPAQFSASYGSLETKFGHTDWFRQVHELRRDPRRYRFLDAAQLVKHAFGLMNRFPEAGILLLYLYWEPRNAGDWPDCLLHRQEAIDFATRVCGSNVKLRPMSYPELWASWEGNTAPRHLPFLKDRFDRRVERVPLSSHGNDLREAAAGSDMS